MSNGSISDVRALTREILAITGSPFDLELYSAESKGHIANWSLSQTPYAWRACS